MTLQCRFCGLTAAEHQVVHGADGYSKVSKLIGADGHEFQAMVFPLRGQRFDVRDAPTPAAQQAMQAKSTEDIKRDALARYIKEMQQMFLNVVNGLDEKTVQGLSTGDCIAFLLTAESVRDAMRDRFGMSIPEKMAAGIALLELTIAVKQTSEIEEALRKAKDEERALRTTEERREEVRRQIDDLELRQKSLKNRDTLHKAGQPV